MCVNKEDMLLPNIHSLHIGQVGVEGWTMRACYLGRGEGGEGQGH